MHKDKLVTEEAVRAAIQSLMAQGLRLDEIKNETLRGKLGGGSNREISMFLSAFKDQAAKDAVLAAAQASTAEALFESGSAQFVSLLRELHITGLQALSTQNDKLSDHLAKAEIRLEASQGESLKLTADFKKSQVQTAELERLSAEKEDKMKSLTAEHAQLTAENQRLRSQNEALHSSFQTLARELAGNRKTDSQSTSTPPSVADIVTAGATVHPIITPEKPPPFRQNRKLPQAQ